VSKELVARVRLKEGVEYDDLSDLRLTVWGQNHYFTAEGHTEVESWNPEARVWDVRNVE
jgi:hypothetical protein